MPHILIVDVEEEIRSLLTAFFRKHGHEVSAAINGETLFAAIERQPVDLVILDVMLEGEDAFSLCRQLRATSKIPVIMLTAVADHVDRVMGLEIGADDYLVKPFDARKLLARVKAVLRRTRDAEYTAGSTSTRPVFLFADWRFDIAKRELRSTDNTLTILSSNEFDILLVFAEHPQRILSREQLLDMARGSTCEAYGQSIDVQVGRLRRKLDTHVSGESVIRTVRGGGYMFTPVVCRGWPESRDAPANH
ncbi:two-component system, OmpR family, response regulator [Paraburkholderia fungorum]|uniref:Two-component system, OmpR family, response regulator n=1 Tax=Paraburkholderia fungorum TaxID=134537 RepID=A0A1H1IV40_9BURK|nr:response regulator transcription factor [Paraburkholderia fungorum]SDR41601.1 two-component system, OmpR family, response regulator [Paraburkholderia fungorum]